MTGRFDADVNGRLRQVTVHREAGRFVVTVDGRTWDVDAARVDAHKMSLLVSGRQVGSGPSVISRTFSYEVSLAADPATNRTDVRIGAVTVPVSLNGRRWSGRRERKEEDGHSGAGPQRLVAPMPGKVVRVLVASGEAVQARQAIVVVEAMKMENELRARRTGVVTELPVTDGQSVEAGALIAVIS